jgi:hypothetical protein
MPSSAAGFSKQFEFGGKGSDMIYKSERDKARFHVRKCDEWGEFT